MLYNKKYAMLGGLLLKRIAFFINSLARGGAERVLSRIIPQLKENYEIYLILIDGSKIEYECSVETIKLGSAEKKNRILYLYDQITAKKKLEKIIKEHNIECVISFLNVPNLINVMTKSNCRKVISIRGAIEKELNNGVHGKIKYYMCKSKFQRADRIVCASRIMCYEMIRNWHVNAEKMVSIENPYDIAEINSLAEQDLSEVEKSFFATHQIVVGVGRFVKEKGYLHLLDSFARLLVDHKTAGLVLVGDGEERGKIEDKIKQLQIENNVLLCGMKKNPYPYIKNAQVFVLSSISEGFPNVLVEAMCCSIPVVACDCKYGPREILDDAEQNLDKAAVEIEMVKYGILVPDFTDRNNIAIEEKNKMLAEAISTLLENDELRQKYAQKSMERAKFYTIERCIEKYNEVIGMS